MNLPDKRTFPLLAGILLICLASNAQSQAPDSKKGDAIVKKMSQKLAAAKSFSFSTTQTHDRIKSDGKKEQRTFSSDAVIQRPNKFYTKRGGENDWQVWYDGKFITAVSDSKKVFAQRGMPATIDETMDELAEKLNMNIAISDVIYSAPYDAFLSGSPKGGFVGQEEIEGAKCNHLKYKSEGADWELWVNEADDLPCRLNITYTGEDGTPNHVITFKNWNLAAEIPADRFAFKIPEGYERIPVLERVRLVEKPQTQSKPSKNE